MLTFTHAPLLSENQSNIWAQWTATVALRIVAGDAVRLSIDMPPATVTDNATPFGAILPFFSSLSSSSALLGALFCQIATSWLSFSGVVFLLSRHFPSHPFTGLAGIIVSLGMEGGCFLWS